MTTYAKATVTIEVHELGTWGNECQLDQVYKQAARAAIGAIRNLAADDKGQHRFRIIGEPVIQVIISEEEKK